MTRTNAAMFSFFAASLLILGLLPTGASAQSTISGVVKDPSGAVVAGVRVEAASDALIERSRAVLTGGDGRYTIVDLRPGLYTMTFTLAGFSTLRRQASIPANVSVPIDAEMKPGRVEETVDVRAAVPTVDIDNVAHPLVLSRTDMDAIPSARNPQSLGSYVSGVHLNTPDVAGSMAVQQTYITAHGNQTFEDTYLLDGMLVNSTIREGQQQNYLDNEIIQETTYQTSGITAEISAGGVYTNMVPKDGGNQFHGDLFAGYVNSDFVGSNIDRTLIDRGVSGQSAVNQIQDIDGSLGGPIKTDKLWFLLAGRKQITNLQAANSNYANGSPGIEYDTIYTGTGRLTWQIDSKNKFSAMWERMWKTIKDDVVSSLFGGGGLSPFVATNPDISSNRRDPVMFYILQGKWTGVVTPRLLFEAGFSLNKEDFNVQYQPGIQQIPFTDAWYADAAQIDTVLLSRSVAGAVNSYNKNDRYVWTGSGSYVTGAHTIKFGVQDSYGPAFVTNVMNGDAYYRFNNGSPQDVQAFNTPTVSKPHLNADFGLYAMDTWRFKHLSVTAGLRWEYFSAQIDPESAPAGRFVPARSFGKVDCNTVKGLGCFKDWAPRLGAVYDVFGNHKTAVKAGVGKYNLPIVNSILNNFNPMFLTSVNITWNDVNGNGIAEGAGFGQGELGPNPNPLFGILQNRALDPNFHRDYNMQYSAGVQQEVWRGVTLNFNWNRRGEYQQIETLNYAVPPSAWTPYTIVNPLDGTPITIYNLQKAYAGVTPGVYETNAPRSLRSNTYDGFETSASARLPHGVFVFAGWTRERQVDRACDESAGANLLNDPNSLRFCDWSGRLYQDLGATPGIPYRNDFKLVFHAPLKWGIEFSGSLYSDPVFNINFATNLAPNSNAVSYSPDAYFAGQQNGIYSLGWNITASTKYPADCKCPNPGGVVDPGLNAKQGTELIPLIAPGARLTPQLNQFDVGLRRIFHPSEKMTVAAEGQVFNILNANTVLGEGEILGKVAPFLPGGPGGQVSQVANPRMLRLSLQFKF
jgi:hypothetical protein